MRIADRAWRDARRLAACVALLLLPLAAPAQPTAPPTAAATATVPPPVPLPEIAKRSDETAVYLQQLEQRLKPGADVDTIEAGLPGVGDRINQLNDRTAKLVAASSALNELDEMIGQWQAQQDVLSGWSATLTASATTLQAELGGLTDLRAMWRATRDEAQAAAVPNAVMERIQGTTSLIAQVRKQVEAYRERVLVLQDRVVQEAARCRDAITELGDVRRGMVGRLLVRDGRPIWDVDRWRGNWSDATTHLRDQTAEAVDAVRAYLAVQLPRVPFQIAVFAVLLALWRGARRRTAGWLAEDSSLASVAAVFEHPLTSALFLALLTTGWIYPQTPLALRRAVAICAVPLLLRVLDRMVDRPILPGLYALGVFFAVDRLRNLVATQPLLEQLLFLLETLACVLMSTWMLRSGRLRQLQALSPRIVAVLEGVARLVVVLFGFALLAGALGFMQLARVVAGAVLGSGYAAMLLYALQRFAQGVWAFLLRTPTLRRARLVQHYRALLQQRGDRLLAWLAVGLWGLATLRSSELLAPLRDAAVALFGAALTVGTFSLSLGDLAAFAVTVWMSFLVSRFTRFVLEEDVYPRVRLTRGLPYALSNIVHYVILFVGFLIALAATGVNLDRFALLAGAFGVGIGFGLQNVVNNFVSGLILLFERPIQVGDTIQIGAISGEVRRIGIRSSTLRTFEGAEVIVPNGTFVSDMVTNWTLSDRLRRIDLSISVAYGSDPEQILTLLRGVASGHPLVLDHPPPVALLTAFGDTALTFELRCWTDRFEQWAFIRSELAIALNKAMTEAGIAVQLRPSPAAAPAAAKAGGS